MDRSVRTSRPSTGWSTFPALSPRPGTPPSPSGMPYTAYWASRSSSARCSSSPTRLRTRSSRSEPGRAGARPGPRLAASSSPASAGAGSAPVGRLGRRGLNDRLPPGGSQRASSYPGLYDPTPTSGSAGPRVPHLAATKDGPGAGRLGPAPTLTGRRAGNCIRRRRT